MTTTMTRATGSVDVRVGGGGVLGALSAEWTKLWGLRSTWLCLVTALLLALATCVLAGYAIEASGGATEISANTLTPMAVMLPQFVLVALASLVVTGEYATGAMRTTLTTVPRRGVVLAAKASVIAAVSLVTGAVIGVMAIVVSALFFGGALEVTGSSLLYGVGGAGLYLALLSLFVLGLGTVLRSTAGTVTATIGLLVGLPMIATIIGNETLLTIVEYTPSTMSQALISGTDSPHSPELSALLLLAWAAAGLAAGYALLRGRDA